MIVGVDIGTSVTKAAIIGRDGRTRASASRPSVLHTAAGWEVEQDLDDVVMSVAGVVRDVLAQTDEAVEAVAVTGQGDGLWLRTDDGRAVRPPISWMDARASGLVTAWREGDDSVVDRVFALTGSGLFPGCHAPLIAHLAATEPESLESAAVAGYCVDAVLQRLTGVITVDASDASLPFLDVTTRTYVDEALEACGIAEWRHLLAEPATPHSVYSLDATGARLLGLPVATPVTAGPYDLQACGFGAGATRLGEGTVVVGTTLSCQVLTDDASIPPGSEPAGMWLCTPDPQTYLRVMPSMVGTACIEWALGLIGEQAEQLDTILASSPPGASGVSALSFLSPAGERAPFVDPLARGQFSGLSLATTRADMVRALCESVAFAARSCFDTLGLDAELSGCGGGLQSSGLAQIFADVMGTPLHVPAELMVGARGAAAVSWDSLREPIDAEAWAADRHVIEPDPSAAAAYDVAYVAYLDDVAVSRQARH